METRGLLSSGLLIPPWAAFPDQLTWIILRRSGYTSHCGCVCSSFRGESKGLDVWVSSSPPDSKGFFPGSTSLVSSISTLEPDISTVITLHFTVGCACGTTTHTAQRLQANRDRYLDEEVTAALSSGRSSSSSSPPSPMTKVLELFTGVE